jgi:hypothetical protein
MARSTSTSDALAAYTWLGSGRAAFLGSMQPVRPLLKLMAFAIAGTWAQPPMLIPGSHDLQSTKITERCDSLWFVSRAPGETVEHTLLSKRREQHIVRDPRGSTVVQVTSVNTAEGSYIDSTVVTRDGLTPMLETAYAGPQVIRYRYDRNRVDVSTTSGDSAPSVTHHEYPHPLFNFDELDLLIRLLPLRPGYQALLPLYSEGDQDAEVDTVQVLDKDSAGVWRVRFADKAIVATYGIADGTREWISYSHRFRTDGPQWTAGTVWRQAFHACGARH